MVSVPSWRLVLVMVPECLSQDLDLLCDVYPQYRIVGPKVLSQEFTQSGFDIPDIIDGITHIAIIVWCIMFKNDGKDC